MGQKNIKKGAGSDSCLLCGGQIIPLPDPTKMALGMFSPVKSPHVKHGCIDCGTIHAWHGMNHAEAHVEVSKVSVTKESESPVLKKIGSHSYIWKSTGRKFDPQKMLATALKLASPATAVMA